MWTSRCLIEALRMTTTTTPAFFSCGATRHLCHKACMSSKDANKSNTKLVEKSGKQAPCCNSTKFKDPSDDAVGCNGCQGQIED
eukprot:3145032-Amphidinium_carterae.1